MRSTKVKWNQMVDTVVIRLQGSPQWSSSPGSHACVLPSCLDQAWSTWPVEYRSSRGMWCLGWGHNDLMTLVASLESLTGGSQLPCCEDTQAALWKGHVGGTDGGCTIREVGPQSQANLQMRLPHLTLELSLRSIPEAASCQWTLLGFLSHRKRGG